MKELHLVIEDEGQQYGNMEEAASIAGTSRAWIETWSGDHHQTDSNTQRKRMPFAENLTIPPPACVEVSRLYVTHFYKVRRLHLIVDLWRR